ncbi:MAG: acyl-CoA-binding protein [Candidatus Helarchaeota archaeon]
MPMDVDPAIQSAFEDAVKRSQQLPTQPTKIQLELYGLYKQALFGDIYGERPRRAKFKARAKFDDWASRKGMSREDAMIQYIKRINELFKTK